jgi:hypothetical protein
MEEDFSDSTVWKKQFSQDGNEYFVHISTGQVRQPPKKNSKLKPLSAEALAHERSGENKSPPKYTGVTYIQQYV